MILSIELTDEQLATIAEMVAQRIGKPAESLSTTEAGKRLGVSRDTILRRVKAGMIPTIPGICPIRIPSAHIDTLLGISNSDVPS